SPGNPGRIAALVGLPRSLDLLRVSRIRLRGSLGSLLALLCSASSIAGQKTSDAPIPTFGTTVVESAGLRGGIYFVKPQSERIPNFKRLKPVGTIYTTRLNIPPRDFKEGFPGITGRLEWFAIDYRGQFFIPSRARYQIGVMSDDGSKLYIDGRLIVDNDGIHPPSGCQAAVELDSGVHTIRISYMQGPGVLVSLQLFIAKSGEPPRIFDTKDFMLPEGSSFAPSIPGTRHVRKLSGGDCWAGR
ncbi:MAG: PA14 domain-containing protein, partial [Bryobacteraceae bacterium]